MRVDLSPFNECEVKLPEGELFITDIIYALKPESAHIKVDIRGYLNSHKKREDSFLSRSLRKLANLLDKAGKELEYDGPKSYEYPEI